MTQGEPLLPLAVCGCGFPLRLGMGWFTVHHHLAVHSFAWSYAGFPSHRGSQKVIIQIMVGFSLKIILNYTPSSHLGYPKDYGNPQSPARSKLADSCQGAWAKRVQGKWRMFDQRRQLIRSLQSTIYITYDSYYMIIYVLYRYMVYVPLA